MTGTDLGPGKNENTDSFGRRLCADPWGEASSSAQAKPLAIAGRSKNLRPPSEADRSNSHYDNHSHEIPDDSDMDAMASPPEGKHG